ncbi:hypothetical protein [Nocardia araoensis]|uniref:hypothetical protein n=1 Tax=Nocardia araoensis TaxID=228600 RepID=UPI0002D46AAF|nr:hypothetical protein [Nocardia araoensis]
MSGKGRAAGLPPRGWRPPPRQRGMVVEFVSEDGRQRKTFNFSVLPGQEEIREEFAAAFAETIGPLGPRRRLGSANSVWTVIRKATLWLAENRPTMSGLAELTIADARMMLNAMRTPNGDRPVSQLRTLLGYCPTVRLEVMREISRHMNGRPQSGAQPYTEQEWRWITIALRRIIRQARDRILTHRQLVENFRAGQLDTRHRLDPDRCLGAVLDYYLRTGELPKATTSGFNSPTVLIAGWAAERPLKSLVHLEPGEVWAFGALLVGLTGLNPSTVFELPVPRTRATAPDEPGIVFVDAIKYRRGPRAAMTVALTDLRSELHPLPEDQRPQQVLRTSLTTSFGVFMLLVDLTASARAMMRTEFAFAFYNASAATGLSDRSPGINNSSRALWVSDLLTGDPHRDEVIRALGLSRLRKTHLERHRRPVAHNPATLSRYLRNMHTVTEEGYQIIREALDAQVTDALARRRIQVHTSPAIDAPDTVVGACVDYEHSPHDGGSRCRQTFLTCLDCSNARAFPRHLPFQLAVLDQLAAARAAMPIARWVGEFAGRVAQLEQIIAEFEPAQRDHARAQITDTHRTMTVRLLAGDLDSL